MIACTGWTYDYIDEEMTLPRVNEILRYFEKVPPVGVSAYRISLAICGEPPKVKESGDDFGKLLEMMNG